MLVVLDIRYRGRILVDSNLGEILFDIVAVLLLLLLFGDFQTNHAVVSL